MFKRNQVVTVGIAGIHSQYPARILRRDSMDGWYIVRELPTGDADRDAYLRSRGGRCDMCVHESNMSA